MIEILIFVNMNNSGHMKNDENDEDNTNMKIREIMQIRTKSRQNIRMTST